MMHLFDMLFPPREDTLVLRDVRTDDFLSLITPKVVRVTQPEAVALLDFADPRVRSALHEAKYHGDNRAFELLSLALAEYLHDAGEGFGTNVLVPLPLGPSRRKERGYNQTEEIARRAAAPIDMAVDTGLLIRTRETVSQVTLPREERRTNMLGAFGAEHPANPAHTYIVFDDVTTTGATLQAAIDAMRDAGATNIIPLALAH
jgi:predicted amidophosphoribosyltransferase